ncbi:MAG: hypothetical protein GY947_15655 [Rhodobacteraceae bacterium]|nr:hypothetical protein [Paracoccaceae bacterium]
MTTAGGSGGSGIETLGFSDDNTSLQIEGTIFADLDGINLVSTDSGNV